MVRERPKLTITYMTYHDNSTTLEERLENAFLSFNREEELKTILQEIRFEAFNQWWEACKNQSRPYMQEYHF